MIWPVQKLLNKNLTRDISRVNNLIFKGQMGSANWRIGEANGPETIFITIGDCQIMRFHPLFINFNKQRANSLFNTAK